MRKKIVFGIVLAALLGVVAIQAQAPGKRNVLVKDDMAPMPETTGYLIEVELPPGAESGRITHPGQEFFYIS